MLHPLPLLLALAQPTDPPPVYHGRLDQIEARPPRVEARVEVDGVLDEAVWGQAAVLTGFSQFAPADGRAADDSTEVLVWYSSTAVHFGVRAFERHGDPATVVRATLAERDRIFDDDHLQILLGTFDDGRQATVFAVNPLGVQGDGILVETGRTGGGFMGDAQQTREPADLRPDFVYQSRGRVTAYGYEVEIRIPFKSLRYQPADVQRWSVNVVRKVQHSGHEDSWSPARRGAASFLAQSGKLAGLTDLRRGLVLDLNPTVTQRVAGSRVPLPDAAPGAGRWDYAQERLDVGANVRWGVTNNLTLNATVNPDFSQVEADAGQFSFDPRSALSFAERRPFFLDGIEQFTVPGNLIYTRRVVQPVVAAKLTGKVRGTEVAVLSAVDDDDYSATGSNPVINVLRVQRDLGRSSRLGMLYTDRVDGDRSNRVVDVDGRLVFGGVYAVQFQGAASRTEREGTTITGPLWDLRLLRNGRAFGFRYQLNGVDEDFRTETGIVSRPNFARANAMHRYTLFGERGSRVETFTTELVADVLWKHDRLFGGDEALEKKLHLNTSSTLRGGWRAGASVLVETFGFDPDLYRGYRVERPLAGGGVDTVPFTGTPRLPNLDWVVTLATPQFRRFSGNAFLIWGKDENFFEWASADILIGTTALNWRPTEQLRVDGAYQQQRYDRRSDGSTVFVRHIPRLELEYQITRPLFVRLIGEYDMSRQDALRDESRTGGRLLVPQPDGTVAHDDGGRSNRFRADALVSYQPTPGTVFFAGYGSAMREAEPLRFGRTLERTSDLFFVKASYLFRM